MKKESYLLSDKNDRILLKFFVWIVLEILLKCVKKPYIKYTGFVIYCLFRSGSKIEKYSHSANLKVLNKSGSDQSNLFGSAKLLLIILFT